MINLYNIIEVTIQNLENHVVDSSVSAPKWMCFIHFVCIGIRKMPMASYGCHVTVKVLNSYQLNKTKKARKA